MPKDLKNSHVALCLGAWLNKKAAALFLCFLPLEALFQEHFWKNARVLQANNPVYVCSLLDRDLLCLIISDQEKKGCELQDPKEPLLSTKS